MIDLQPPLLTQCLRIMDFGLKALTLTLGKAVAPYPIGESASDLKD